MGTDLTRSNILFPFTPNSGIHRALLMGMNDCFMVIPSAGASGSPVIYKEYFIYLYSITASPTDVVYLFKASFPGGIQDIPFTIDRDNGILRVTSDNTNIHAVLIVDSDNMYATAGSHVIDNGTAYAEVEPAKIVWRTDTLTSIVFKNAYRHWDPDKRSADGSPLATVMTVTGGPMRFESGYNVSLQYDENTQTLYIRGIPGAGRGLPSIIPWDVAPPSDLSNPIKSINGITGNVPITGSDSITIVQTPGVSELTVEVSDE